MSVLVCTLIIMSTGYAILTQVIKVDGTVTVERDWDVKITGITDGTPVGAAENEVAPSYDATTASFSTLLYNKGDSMTYSVTVENFGSWDAKLETITLTDSNNPAVKFTVSGVNEGDALPSGSTHVLTVKVEYNSAFTGELTNNVGTLTVSLTYVQDDSSTVVIPPTPSENSVVYRIGATSLGIGDSIDGVETTTDPSTLGKNYYLKHDAVDNKITASYVCFVTDGEHCMQGGDASYYAANKELLQSQENWFTNNSGICSFDDPNPYCHSGNFGIITANPNGGASVNTVSNTHCTVSETGSSYCG